MPKKPSVKPPEKKTRQRSNFVLEQRRFGILVRLKRNERNVSIVDLAPIVGMSASQLTRIEHGDCACGLFMLERLVALLGLEIGALVRDCCNDKLWNNASGEPGILSRELSYASQIAGQGIPSIIPRRVRHTKTVVERLAEGMLDARLIQPRPIAMPLPKGSAVVTAAQRARNRAIAEKCGRELLEGGEGDNK